MAPHTIILPTMSTYVITSKAHPAKINMAHSLMEEQIVEWMVVMSVSLNSHYLLPMSQDLLTILSGVLSSSRGKTFGIFHQYAHLGTGKTIRSANQMRHFGIEILDTPRALAGKQRIQHPDGYVILS
jgi:hypothetical protein